MVFQSSMDDTTFNRQHDQSTPISTRTTQIDRMINSDCYNSRPSHAIYSDRFISSRTDSNFTLFGISNSPALPEDGSFAYKSLLREALLGSGKKDSSGLSAGRNIFRYKTETKQPLHSLQPFGFDDELVHVIKAPMKILGSPYEILDVPGFEDDFYSNLVDWSTNNVLVVGFGSCVYLWNAYRRDVTRLCDLGIYDKICSIGWDQCETQLAVGTNHAKVQKIVTGAGDETLLFWKVFPYSKSQNDGRNDDVSEAKGDGAQENRLTQVKVIRHDPKINNEGPKDSGSKDDT
ncbi:hypothetical protein V6N13_088344 [Hibiscus sabdariffa]|uniref:Uncharacterized protein n=1 Tax=Hibiscus sabdariffa TaxID=183260 RepID=A0ABR2FZX7_9ROSI